MDGDAHVLRRLDGLIWAIIILVGGVVLLSNFVATFRIAWLTFLAPGTVCALLTLGSWFYTLRRPEPALASALTGTAQLIAFAAVAAPLSYLAASLGLPLHDAAFDAADRALGLDWPRLVAWMNHHGSVQAVLRVAYLSLAVQMAVVVLALAFMGRLIWLRIFLLTFALSALFTIAVSALLPAQGAWGHYGVEVTATSAIVPVIESSWPVFHGLRDGSFRLLTGIGSEGIITFPSLHATLAVIVAVALWPVPIVRWFAIVVNAAMLVATPFEGSHYFVDVIAGIAIAVVCWAAVDAWVRHGLAAKPTVTPALPAETGLLARE
jgi:PAP2 superfamily